MMSCDSYRAVASDPAWAVSRVMPPVVKAPNVKRKKLREFADWLVADCTRFDMGSSRYCLAGKVLAWLADDATGERFGNSSTFHDIFNLSDHVSHHLYGGIGNSKKHAIRAVRRAAAGAGPSELWKNRREFRGVDKKPKWWNKVD